MFCKNCGESLESHARFCAHCGTKIETTATIETVPLESMPTTVGVASESSVPDALVTKISETVSSPSAQIEQAAIKNSVPVSSPPAPLIKQAIQRSGPTTYASLASTCCVIAGIVTVIYAPPEAGWIGLLIYLGIAVGTWMMSPIAAILGLVLACGNVAVFILPFISDSLKNPAPAPLFVFIFVIWIRVQYKAVRDTFVLNAELGQ